MRSKIEKDRVQIYAPVGILLVSLGVAFMISLTVSIIFMEYFLVCLPVTIALLVAFLVALWESLHPLVIDKDGVEGYFSFFKKERYSWDDVTEMVLCLTRRAGITTMMGSPRDSAIGITIQGLKPCVFVCPELTSMSCAQLIETVNHLAGYEIMDDYRNELVGTYARGSHATRIAGIILVLTLLYISVVFLNYAL